MVNFQTSSFNEWAGRNKGLLVGLGLLGAGAIAALWKYMNRESKAEKMTAAFTKLYQNDVINFVNRCHREDLFPIGGKSDIEEYANKRLSHVQNIQNNKARDIVKAMFQIEAVCISLVRGRVPVMSWEDGLPVSSPMDLWRNINWEIFKLLHMDNSPLFRKWEDLSAREQEVLNDYAKEMNGFSFALMEESGAERVETYYEYPVVEWLSSINDGVRIPFIFKLKKAITERTNFILVDMKMPEGFLFDDG